MEGPYTTIVSPETLRDHLDDPLWLIVDCRHNLADFAAGRKAYDAGHIPGACFADVENDLAGKKTGTNGRHPLPDPQQFAEFLRSHGASDTTQIVAYDDGADMYAARCWFLCRWIGHDAVAILDGGISAWRSAGFSVDPSTPPSTPLRVTNSIYPSTPLRVTNSISPSTPLRVTIHPELVVDAGSVLASIADKTMTVLDARGGERFRGEIEPLDRVAGHIPGAQNRSFKENFGEGGRLKSPEQLREEFGAYGNPSRVVHQCGSGVSSAVNALAMERANLRGWRVYVGSWSEWSSDPTRPVETGPAR